MTRHAIRNTALFMLVAALCSGASCVSDGDSGGYGGNPRRGDDRYDDYSDANRPRRIPSNADVVKEGNGKLRWRADLDGTVFVYDQTGDVVRYAGRVSRGANVQVIPDDDRVTVDGASVSTENLAKDHYHQLYFTTGRGGYDNRTPYGKGNDRDARPAAKSPANGVPAGADKLARGSGTLEIAAAPNHGTVYVFDDDTGDVVYRANLRHGAAFKLVPREGRVYVDGDSKDRPKFARGHTLTLYFAGR